jgi:hypothetical protein
MTEQEWLTCDRFGDMVEFVRGRMTARKKRLFAVACCRRVWSFMPNDQCYQAINIAELHADGKATNKELVEAKSRAEAVAHAMPTRWTPPRSAAWAAVWVAAGGGGWFRAVQTAISVTTRAAADLAWQSVEATGGVDAAYSASQIAERETTWAEQRELAVLLRHVVGNPFRPLPGVVQWPSTVLHLADALYNGQECGFALHDALLDAGHPDLAEHFHQEQQHPKGCWALDLILAKF